MTPAMVLDNLLADTGLHLATQSAGDGRRRYYRLFPKGEPRSYHESSRSIFTATGRSEAIAFLIGYRCAQIAKGGQQ